MGQLIGAMQDRIKRSSSSLMVFLFRLFSGAMLGLTFAIIGQVFMGYGQFSFSFVIVLVTGLFLRASRTWSINKVFVFDLVCLLIGLLLKMYILVAPGV